MDLAEREDRLRDEWITYAQAGFRLRRQAEPRILSPCGTDMQSISASIHVSVCLFRPDGAPEGMNTDAENWLNLWIRWACELILSLSETAPIDH